jgi:endonuclease YncB( thermonuclease family)
MAAVAAACGSDSAGPVPITPLPPASSTGVTVTSITDGDTLRFSPPVEGASVLRLLEVDTAETTQVPWGDLATAELRRLAPPATELQLETEQMHIDPFGRLLAHAIRRDGLDVNKEMLRLGQAVLLVIWPNVGRFEEYRAAEIEAQAAGRGIWNPANPLTELPFEYRLRVDRDTPFRPVGDYFTRRYVDAADYRRVDVNNRVFFNNSGDASAAGYQRCARSSSGDYSPECFASAR